MIQGVADTARLEITCLSEDEGMAVGHKPFLGKDLGGCELTNF